MAKTLTDLLPTPTDLDPADVVATRKRLESFLGQFWAELDTRPNSVFGDIHLTPFAVLMTGLEVAMDRFRSDLDLGNVAQGVIWDDDFVRSFLRNFGVTEQGMVPATGTIKLSFTDDKDYVFDADTTFTFGDQIFYVNRDEGSPITISNTAAKSPRRVLTRVSDGNYVVHLPVFGPAGTQIIDGSVAVTSFTATELTSVLAAGDFNSGLPPETTPQMALKAQKTFASANLTSRSGVISFLVLRFPQIIGASPTITGDREMIRPGRNPLGLLEGAIDVFVRSRAAYISGESTLPLVYDLDAQAWVGRINLPVVPAFMSVKAGVFQVSNFLNDRGVNQIYAQSSHPFVDNLGISYSRYEQLGIRIVDTDPADFTPSFVSDVKARSDGSSLVVNGEYAGYIFNTTPGRSVTIRFDSATTYEGMVALQANVIDKQTGETGSIFFVPNNTDTPTSGIVIKDTVDYKKFFNGMDLEFVPQDGVFNPSAAIGFLFDFSYQGRSANFTFSYLYDPALVQVDSVLQNPDNKPVNVSLLTRSTIICYIPQFVVNYRVPFGTRVDQDAARNAISNYVNSIMFPDVYEEAVVGMIINSLGGVLQNVTKTGRFYPSLATAYVDRDGAETPIPRPTSTTLAPPLNDLGFGARNISFLLDPENIIFNATVS